MATPIVVVVPAPSPEEVYCPACDMRIGPCRDEVVRPWFDGHGRPLEPGEVHEIRRWVALAAKRYLDELEVTTKVPDDGT